MVYICKNLYIMKLKKKHFEIDHLLKKEGELTQDEILLINSYYVSNTLALVLIDYIKRNPN